MRSEALLYKKLATLRTDVAIRENLEDLRWRGIPTPDFRDFCAGQGFTRLSESDLPTPHP